MALVTISRQIASFGDEISSLVAKKLNYKFIGRKEIEERITNLGFPKEKLHKFDEKKPGFFVSLSKDCDEYLDYLQTAILEEANENDCVFIGRGSFIILSELKNHMSFRFVANDKVRIDRILSERDVNEKQAKKIILESDNQRLGFHKSFFNYEIDDPSLYHAVINTGLFSIEDAAEMIVDTVKKSVKPEDEVLGKKRIDELLICQRIVNLLIFEYGLNINFFKAVAHGNKITLQGVADSSAIVNRALTLARCELPAFEVISDISVVQDLKAYQ